MSDPLHDADTPPSALPPADVAVEDTPPDSAPAKKPVVRDNPVYPKLPEAPAAGSKLKQNADVFAILVVAVILMILGLWKLVELVLTLF